MQGLKYLREIPRKTIYYGLSVVMGLGIIGGIYMKINSQHQPIADEVTIVQTEIVGDKGTVQSYTYSGEIRGRYESKLAFQVNGKIINRNVQLGSHVNAGDVLMQIDAKDVMQTVNSNSAQVNSSVSQLQLAESNLRRYRELFEDRVVSRSQYEQYLNAYNVAVAGVQQAQAQYTQGSNQLDYCLLQADKPGVISSITAEIGQVVSAGQVVVTVVQDGEREVEISVPENRLEELRNATNFKVTFWALPNTVVEGKVREIAPMADSVTRTFKVRISLLNLPPEVKLGMTATVNIPGSNAQQALKIPLTAIYQSADTPAVWVVTGDTVTLRSVKTGTISTESSVEILEGLQPGECIVTKGIHKLKQGQRVQVGGESL